MKPKNSLGIPAVLFAVFVWGISFVSTKVVLKDLPPLSIAFFRQFVALVPLLILMRLKKESFRLKKGELLTFIFATLFGIVLYFFFENRALTMTSASNASMIAAAVPVFALITEGMARRTRIQLPVALCIAASFIGVYFVIFEGGKPDFESKSFLGNVLMLGSMLSWIIYTFISRKLGESYSSLKMTTLQSILSIPLFIPFILNEIKLWKAPSTIGLLNLVFLGVFCSALAYVFYLYGIQTLGPILPSALLNLIPVVTILAGSILLSEELSIFQILGAVLIIGSLFMLTLIRTKEKAITGTDEQGSDHSLTARQ
jgi:drug/metabolite transporter (DMT)-like permease